MIPYFENDLYSERLVLKHLEPNLKNAKMIFEMLKKENKSDYVYEAPIIPNVLPSNLQETLQMMKNNKSFEDNNGVCFYMFYNGIFVGVRKIAFFEDINSLKLSSVWVIKSVRRQGLAHESFNVIEKIAFEKLKVNIIARVNVLENYASLKLARKMGFYLDGISRQSVLLHDNKIYDLMFWSKLSSDKR